MSQVNKVDDKIIQEIHSIAGISFMIQTHPMSLLETNLEYDVREFFYGLTGILNEMYQGLKGGHFDTDYINEKLSMMCAYADHIKREEL